MTLNGNINTERVLPTVVARGADYMPGNAFYLDSAQGTDSLRLAFSMYSPDELTEGVRRIAEAMELHVS